MLVIAFVALTVGLVEGTAKAQSLEDHNNAYSRIVFDSNGYSNGKPLCYKNTWATFMFAAITIGGRTIWPKRLRFGQEEWICLQPEEYQLLSERLSERILLDRLIV